MRQFLYCLGIGGLCWFWLMKAVAAEEAVSRPNILVAMADDWGFPHAGVYGDPVVRTPTFDRLAREGILFQNAFVSSPSCTPSRSALLTGQYHWRLEEAANLWSTLQARFRSYPEVMREAGYFIGHSRKAWGPGRIEVGGRTEDPAGPRFQDFGVFLRARPKERPFCYWFGSPDPHRPYEKGSGVGRGMDLAKVPVPGWLPDDETVRSDLADYYFEVERFDREVGEALELLREAGELDNTLVVMTGDNGLPFPRAKSNLYDPGVHVPLVLRWPARARAGLAVSDFVSFVDLAPTFLEAAGLPPLPEMTGRSLFSVLDAGRGGWVDPKRDHVIFGKERHVPSQERGIQSGYPGRALRNRDFLYIVNYRPDLWPNGIADGSNSEKGNAFADCDDSPTKSLLVARREDPAIRPFFDLAFGRRPAEELYDLRRDPNQRKNLAGEAAYQETRQRLADQLTAELRATADPRVVGGAEKFEEFPYYGQRIRPANREDAVPAAREARQATGVKVGEVTATSAMVWTRVTQSANRKDAGWRAPGKQPGQEGEASITTNLPPDLGLLEGAYPGQAGRVRVRYGSAANLARARETPWVSVDAATDFSHTFPLRDLSPGRQWFFAVETTGPEGRPQHGVVRGGFRTAPAATDPAAVTFCVETCQGYPDLDDPEGFHLYPAMLSLKPDFVVFTGDYVYYDNDPPRATSVALARYHWQRMVSLPRHRELLRSVATYWMKDDHDTWANDSWPGIPPGRMSEFTFEQGQAVFREQTPLGSPGYRSFRWGQDLQVWLLEGRDYRSPNRMADGPDKTILGEDQKAWLRNTLAESDATWRVVISATPILGPDRSGKGDNHANAAFQHEGDELRAMLAAAASGAHRPLLVCGDRHWQYHSVHPETGLEEFSVGPASDVHIQKGPGVDPAIHRFYRSLGGFFSATVWREDGVARLTCRLHDVHGTVVHRAEWTQEVL